LIERRIKATSRSVEAGENGRTGVWQQDRDLARAWAQKKVENLPARLSGSSLARVPHIMLLWKVEYFLIRGIGIGACRFHASSLTGATFSGLEPCYFSGLLLCCQSPGGLQRRVVRLSSSLAPHAPQSPAPPKGADPAKSQP